MKKIFSKFYWVFGICTIFWALIKKDQLQSVNIWELLTPRNVVTSLSESSCFRGPFQSQGVHGSQTLLKLTLVYFHPTFLKILEKLSIKGSLLVTSHVSGLFGKMLIAHHMHSRHRWEKFPQQVQTLIWKKKDIFLNFIAFLESARNSVNFEEKGQLHKLNI